MIQLGIISSKKLLNCFFFFTKCIFDTSIFHLKITFTRENEARRVKFTFHSNKRDYLYQTDIPK